MRGECVEADDAGFVADEHEGSRHLPSGVLAGLSLKISVEIGNAARKGAAIMVLVQRVDSEWRNRRWLHLKAQKLLVTFGSVPQDAAGRRRVLKHLHKGL